MHLFTDWPSAWIAFLVITLTALGMLEIRQARNQKSATEKDQKPPDNHRPSVATLAAPQKNHPTEEEHRSAEQACWDRHLETRNRVDWIGRVTSALSTLATVGVILSFYEAGRQADIAQATLIQSNRAWINVSVDPVSILLTWDAKGQSLVKAAVKGTNEGNSPATDVRVLPVLFFPRGGQGAAIRARIKLPCSGWTMLRNIVFIKDDISLAWATTLDDGSVQQWVDRVKERAPPGQRIPVPLSLAVCAACEIVGDGIAHHAARIYAIRSAASGGREMPFLGESMAGDQIALEKPYEGEYAD